DQQAIGEDPGATPRELRKAARYRARLAAAHTRVADAERHTGEEDEEERRRVREAVPESGADANVVPAELGQVVEAVVEHHHEDGDTTECIDFPVPLTSGGCREASLQALRQRDHQ